MRFHAVLLACLVALWPRVARPQETIWGLFSAFRYQSTQPLRQGSPPPGTCSDLWFVAAYPVTGKLTVVFSDRLARTADGKPIAVGERKGYGNYWLTLPQTVWPRTPEGRFAYSGLIQVNDGFYEITVFGRLSTNAADLIIRYHPVNEMGCWKERYLKAGTELARR